MNLLFAETRDCIDGAEFPIAAFFLHLVHCFWTVKTENFPCDDVAHQVVQHFSFLGLGELLQPDNYIEYSRMNQIVSVLQHSRLELKNHFIVNL